MTSRAYYRPGAPFRDDVNVRGDAEMPLVIRGHVLARLRVTPLAGALLDVWQADADGVYDNASADFHLRGRFYADGDGQYAFTTVLPGLYPGRTRHIHPRQRRRPRAAHHADLLRRRAGERRNAFIDPALIIPLSPEGLRSGESSTSCSRRRRRLRYRALFAPSPSPRARA